MLKWQHATQSEARYMQEGANFHLDEAELDDAGEYVCSAVTDAGTKTASGVLQIRGKNGPSKALEN